LTATAEVIDSVSGLTTGFVTDASVWANVQAASLAVFTLPAGSNLQISSDIGSQISDQTKEGGTVQNTTTVNGMVVPSLEVAVDSHLDAIVDVDFDAPAGYTLSSQVVYAGGTPGIQGLVIFATSGVTNLVPEPASMVVWGLGAAGLAFACARRRKARASA
jgi:MYXO-CTERM domain-containing protein